jgi:hypothetical protein
MDKPLSDWLAADARISARHDCDEAEARAAGDNRLANLIAHRRRQWKGALSERLAALLPYVVATLIEGRAPFVIQGENAAYALTAVDGGLAILAIRNDGRWGFVDRALSPHEGFAALGGAA